MTKLLGRIEHSKGAGFRQPWSELGRFVGQPRRVAVDDGTVYLIRDVFVNGRLSTCQYAVRNPNGSKRWLPCSEGSKYSDMKPWRMKRHASAQTGFIEYYDGESPRNG